MVFKIVGAVLALLSVVSVIVCTIKTPSNLRGWYGVKFSICALPGIIGGVLLVVFSFLK